MKIYTANLDDYTLAVKQLVPERYELAIFKDDELIYECPTFLYSLRDCATRARFKLGMKGRRIKWNIKVDGLSTLNN